MPKEYVFSTLCLPEMEGHPASLPFRCSVRWGRDEGDIQIATVDENDGDDGSGFFVDLDRRGINDLIRLLRKARDQSCGRDE